MKNHVFLDDEFDLNDAEFIREVVDKEVVYLLVDEEQVCAECPSEFYFDSLGEPLGVYCFWSTPEAALACRHDEWANYELVALTLDDFIQDALPDMAQDNYRVGLNFDEELYGSEYQAMTVLAYLLAELEQQDKETLVDDFDDLQRQVSNWQQQNQAQRIVH